MHTGYRKKKVEKETSIEQLDRKRYNSRQGTLYNREDTGNNCRTVAEHRIQEGNT